MEITYVIIVSIITYILGAITKIFVDAIPNKYIPIQNVVIGIASGLICYFAKIETNLLTAIVLCLTASNAAGGINGLTKVGK